MPRGNATRRDVEQRSGGADLAQLGVAVAAPLLGGPLPVPRDVRLGDTPDGEPAILWRVPPPADE